MINFACKRFDVDEIIKCGLGLTKSELSLFYFLVKNSEKEYTTEELAQETKLNITTIQKAVKKLAQQEILNRYQVNLSSGGYQYTYACATKKKIRLILKNIIRNWSQKVEDSIETW